MGWMYIAFKAIIDALITLTISEKSLFLDGVDDLVDMGSIGSTDDLALSSGNFTISLWVRPSATLGDAYGTLIEKATGGTGAGGWNIRMNNTSGEDWQVCIGGSAVSISSIAGDFIPEQWQHIAVTWDGTSIRAYNNAYLAVTSASPSQPPTTTADLNIGGSPWTTRHFAGLIDQVVILDTDLDVSEIKELITFRDVSAHSKYANVIAWWDFDSVSGSTVSDLVGSVDGTLTGGATTSDCIPAPYSYSLVDGLITATDTYDNAVPWQESGFAKDLDGTNDYVGINDHSSLDFTTNFTLSAWVKRNNIGSELSIITKWTYATQGSWAFEIQTSGELKFFLANSLTDAGTSHGSTTTVKMNTGMWYHVALVYNGGGATNADKAKIYVNSDEHTISFTGTMPSTIPNSTANVHIGRFGGTLGRYYNGQIGDVFLTNTSLSSANMISVFNKHSPRDERQYSLSADLKGYYRGYNSTIGTGNVLDLSGNSNHGTMTNMSGDDIIYSQPRTTISLQNGDEGSYAFATNKYSVISDSADFSFGDGSSDSAFSVSVWYKRGSTATGGLIGKYGSATSAREWLLTDIGGGTYRLYLNDVNGFLINSRFNITASVGEWDNVIFTYDGTGGATAASGVKGYSNGVSQSMTATNNASYVSMSNTTEDVHVGRYAGSNYLNGNLCHVSVWNKKLELCDIDEISQSGPQDLNSHQSSADLISWYKMDGSDVGSTMTDSAGSNDGTYTNAPSFESDEYPTN